MGRFVKIMNESIWINTEKLDGIMIRPQLQAVGAEYGTSSLEELHEMTGYFEVIAMFNGNLGPISVFPTKEAAEAFVDDILQSFNQ